MTTNAHTFESFTLTHSLPSSVLSGLRFAVADVVDLDFAEWGGIHGEHAEKRLASQGIEDVSEWEIVGAKLVDHSGWCDYEGKMEYLYEDLRLLIRKADLAAARASLA